MFVQICWFLLGCFFSYGFHKTVVRRRRKEDALLSWFDVRPPKHPVSRPARLYNALGHLKEGSTAPAQIPYRKFLESCESSGLSPPLKLSDEERLARATAFRAVMAGRRSVRFFSQQPVPLDLVQECIRAAGLAPSGANCQPWHFAIVQDPAAKQQIREIVEREERVNYERRMAKSWVSDLKSFMPPILVEKAYITNAPYVVVLFKQTNQRGDDDDDIGSADSKNKKPTYYPSESVGIAAGLFLTALHLAGLATITTTPMNAGPQIRALCRRPASEKCCLLLPVGLPTADATVPNIVKLELSQIMTVL